jgi:hypothetical protein
MADDRSIRGAADRTRINLQEDYEVRYWTQKWNVSREQLAAAVREAGVMAADVAKTWQACVSRCFRSAAPPHGSATLAARAVVGTTCARTA